MRLSRIFGVMSQALLLAIPFVGLNQGLILEARAQEQITALVPAYFYPSYLGSPWDDLTTAAASIPIEAIMNPDSGPGSQPNSDYQAAVGKLQAAGGKVIGYVPTFYGARPQTCVLADVQSYITWYNVDGIFLDQMGNQVGTLDYVALYNAIKALGNLHVVGNPGSPFDPAQSLLAAADTLNIFEGPLTNSDPDGPSFALYPKRGPYTGLPLWFESASPSQIANIVYDATTGCQAGYALLKALRFNAGYVFITDGVLPNPYGGLPAYWTQEVEAIALINALIACGD
jgi:hypothetical protein